MNQTLVWSGLQVQNTSCVQWGTQISGPATASFGRLPKQPLSCGGNQAHARWAHAVRFAPAAPPMPLRASPHRGPRLPPPLRQEGKAEGGHGM